MQRSGNRVLFAEGGRRAEDIKDLADYTIPFEF